MRAGLLVLALALMVAAAPSGRGHHEGAADLPDYDLVLEQRADFVSANAVFRFHNEGSQPFGGPLRFWIPVGATLAHASVMDAGQRQVLHSLVPVTQAEAVDGGQTLMRADLTPLNFTLEPDGEIRVHLAYRTGSTEIATRLHDDFAHARVRVAPMAGWDAQAPGLNLTLVDAGGSTFIYEDGGAQPLAVGEGEEVVVQFAPRAAAAGAGWGSLIGILVVGILVGALLGRWVSR